MRDNFAKIDGQRKEFTATFDRFGTRSGYQGHTKTTILLKDIKCNSNDRIAENHLWFTSNKGFEELKLISGDVIQFTARVKEYHKGYKGYREDVQFERPIEKDFKLSHPTKIMIIKKAEPEDFPDDYYQDMGGYYPQDKINYSLEQPKGKIQRSLDDFN